MDDPPRASGVLPFAVVDGRVRVLLGKESWRPDYEANHMWCDFGGGINGRKPPDFTARDELHEETLGCVKLPLGWQASLDRGGRCAARLVSAAGQRQPYWMYVVCVPHVDRLAREFGRRRRTAMSAARPRRRTTAPRHGMDLDTLRQLVPSAFNCHGVVYDKYLEKDALRWVDLDKLEQWVAGAHGMCLRPEFCAALAANAWVFDLLRACVSAHRHTHVHEHSLQ